MENQVPSHYNELKDFATKYGWKTEYELNKGVRFIKENTWIWPCRQGCQCADLIDGRFVNHKGFNTGLMLGEMFQNIKENHMSTIITAWPVDREFQEKIGIYSNFLLPSGNVGYVLDALVKAGYTEIHTYVAYMDDEEKESYLNIHCRKVQS